MTATTTPILLHGHNVTRPTPAELARVDRHQGLVVWTLDHKCRGILNDGYTRADALQDGWLGLLAAVQQHGDGPEFTGKAVSAIWRAISRGRGLHSGRNQRRRSGRRTPEDRPVLVSLDRPAYADDSSSTDLAATIPAPDPGPAATVLDSIDLATAVAAGRSAVTDHIDIAVLAWMLAPSDTRTHSDIAAELGRHPEAIRRARRRLTARMARSIATTDES